MHSLLDHFEETSGLPKKWLMNAFAVTWSDFRPLMFAFKVILKFIPVPWLLLSATIPLSTEQPLPLYWWGDSKWETPNFF
jgi:hypothetical protein